MRPRTVATTAPRFQALRIALGVIGVGSASIFGAFGVWFVGFDWLWAFAAVLAVGLVGVALSIVKLEEQSAWDPPGREPSRGVRLALPMMEESLAASDRLARPAYTRPIRFLLTNERDDRLARGTIVRQMRALLLAELRVRGVDPARDSEEAVVAILGTHALAVLQQSDITPVTTGVIASCLDTVERLATEPPSQ